MALPKTTQNQMRRRICRSVIGQFGFRSVRRRHCRRVVARTSHIIGSQIKKGGTFGMQHPSF